MDLACALGGPNPALPPNSVFSQAHFDKVSTDPDLTSLAQYDVLFVDSLTALSRLSYTHCEQLPEAVTDRGKKDLRGTYGVVAREMIGWLQQMQHARAKTIIFVSVLERSSTTSARHAGKSSSKASEQGASCLRSSTKSSRCTRSILATTSRFALSSARARTPGAFQPKTVPENSTNSRSLTWASSSKS